MAPVDEGHAVPALGCDGLTLPLPAALAAGPERAARGRGQSAAELIAGIVRDFLRQQARGRPPAQG